MENLRAICSIDKTNNEICSSLYFWKPIFKKRDLILPSIRFEGSGGWLLAFEKELLDKNYAIELVNSMSNIYQHDFWMENDSGYLFHADKCWSVFLDILTLKIYRKTYMY